MLAYIGIFCISFFGIFILDRLDERKIRDYVIIYPILLVLTNMFNLFIFKLRYGEIEEFQTRLNTDVSFFIKYCFLGLILNVFFISVYIILGKTFKFNLLIEKDEKSKKKKNK